MRPIPFSPPSLFSSVSKVAGLIFLPLMATALPFSNSISISVGLSGAYRCMKKGVSDMRKGWASQAMIKIAS